MSRQVAVGPKGSTAGAVRAPDVYVATESFTANVAGEPLMVQKGELVRAGHPLLREQGGYFEPAASHVHYDTAVEQATAAPGEQRAR